ncbi:hypothetical protein B566_EDAN009730 [Ephemera danica]|nr:hypothetical protein B566_EDAN009730 [Ephemera danica]
MKSQNFIRVLKIGLILLSISFLMKQKKNTKSRSGRKYAHWKSLNWTFINNLLRIYRRRQVLLKCTILKNSSLCKLF